jgi:hypothetical protein
MNTGGWIFMIVSWGCILALAVFCFCRTLSSPEKEDGQENK